MLTATLKALKLPLKLLVRLMGNKQKPKKTELEQKQLKHVRNFAPTHYSWQQKSGKPSKNSRQKKTKPPTQKSILSSIIQCLVCGGIMKKKQSGYDCLNCENFLSNKAIKTKK